MPLAYVNATVSDIRILVAYVKAAKTPRDEAGQIPHPENMVPPNQHDAPITLCDTAANFFAD
jgi:hypothetical protein